MKITPELILFPLKLGGSLHSVPLPINFKKQITFAIKWVIKLVKDQHRRISVSLIADCLVNALYDKGASMEKKLAVYNLGSSNRHLVRFFR
jgi:ribosomal protein S7